MIEEPPKRSRYVAPAMETNTVTLKILVDTKSQKVLFAEAGKDFVDFLFTLLALPLGAITGLLESQCVVGSIGNLYQSIKNLSQTYIQPGKSKDSVLKPNVCTSETPLLLLPNTDSSPEQPNFYLCQSSINSYQTHAYVADNPNASCPSCNTKMAHQASYVVPVAAADKPDSDNGGFVKGVVTYMVMDNLEVTPMSTISSISLINKFNIQELGALEEKVVEFGITEGLELLKASLQTKAVLTSVFMGKKAA